MIKIGLILLTTAVTSLKAKSYKYIGDFSSKSTSKYLESFVNNVSAKTFGMIYNSFPEPYSAPNNNSIHIDNLAFNTLYSVLAT